MYSLNGVPSGVTYMSHESTLVYSFMLFTMLGRVGIFCRTAAGLSFWRPHFFGPNSDYGS